MGGYVLMCHGTRHAFFYQYRVDSIECWRSLYGHVFRGFFVVVYMNNLGYQFNVDLKTSSVLDF